MKLTLTTNDGEVLATWEIKPGNAYDDGDFDPEDLDAPIDEALYIEDLKKYRCDQMLDGVRDEILNNAKHGRD